MYISLREHCIAVTQLKVTVCHIFISQMKIYKKKENLSINISIKSRPVFLSASRSSVAKATSVPKVYPSRRRRSGCCSMITGFAGPKTILKQIFKRLIIFYLNTHSRSSVAKATSVPKVYPSRRRRSGCCSMITGFAGPKTILKQIFKRLIIFYLNTHTHTHTPKKNIKNNTKRKRKNKEKKVLVISLHKFLGFWSYLLGYDQSY